MFIERHSIVTTTATGGAATAYSAANVSGRVLQIRYVPAASNELATGADATITGEVSGVAVATLTDIGTTAFTRAIRQATHGIDGSASLYAAGGEPVEAPVVLADERIKIVIAQGGDVKSGTWHVYVG